MQYAAELSWAHSSSSLTSGIGSPFRNLETCKSCAAQVKLPIFTRGNASLSMRDLEIRSYELLPRYPAGEANSTKNEQKHTVTQQPDTTPPLNLNLNLNLVLALNLTPPTPASPRRGDRVSPRGRARHLRGPQSRRRGGRSSFSALDGGPCGRRRPFPRRWACGA